MRNLTLGSALAFGLAVIGVTLMTPRPAEAFIHEIIGALCRFGNEEVIPPGQVKEGTRSFVRALQATGFITGIDVTPTEVTVHFNPDIPASKFKSAGGPLTIPDGFGPGVALTLDPLVIPDPDFAAHSHCHFSPF